MITNNIFEFYKRQTKNKKVVLYGAGTVGRSQGFLFERLNINVAYYVDQNYLNLQGTMGQYVIKSPYDLMYENKEKLFILTCVNNSFLDSIVEVLDSMGFIRNKHFFNASEYTAAPTDCFDPFLGYSRYYNYSDKAHLYGFDLYGKEDAKYKIVTLGGSTTDGTMYGIKSWPQKLFEIIDSKEVCIYNGGIAGYDSAQELIKLIRDVIILNPNLVISYSGANEKARDKKGLFPYASVYLQNTIKSLMGKLKPDWQVSFGMENNSSAAHEFIIIRKMMKAICDTFGIDFMTVLQPDLRLRGRTYFADEDEELESMLRSYFSKEEICDADAFILEIERENIFSDTFIDGRDFFQNDLDVFVDWVHVDERGNQIVASRIFQLIEANILKELKK